MKLYDSDTIIRQQTVSASSCSLIFDTRWFDTNHSEPSPWLCIEERGKLELVMDGEPLYRELVPQLINQQ